MALATATPMAMIAPMKDWMLSVVPVSQSMSTTPAMTAGAVATTTKRQLQRLEVGRQQQEDDHHRQQQAGAQAVEHLLQRHDSGRAR